MPETETQAEPSAGQKKSTRSKTTPARVLARCVIDGQQHKPNDRANVPAAELDALKAAGKIATDQASLDAIA